jgi:hypothetical protein
LTVQAAAAGSGVRSGGGAAGQLGAGAAGAGGWAMSPWDSRRRQQTANRILFMVELLF